MNNFDSVCLNCIHIECNKIKKYICDMINKKTFDLNFDHNMNEDGIEKAIYENFCLIKSNMNLILWQMISKVILTKLKNHYPKKYYMTLNDTTTVVLFLNKK